MSEQGPLREDKVRVNIRMRKYTLEREKKNRLIVWLAVILTSTITAEAVLSLSGILVFNFIEVLIDLLIAIYAYAFLYRHYSSYRPSKAALVNHRKSWWLLFIILFVPSYAGTFIVYSMGFKAIYDPTGFAVFYLIFQAVFFFIATSWFWNRRFVNLTMPTPLRLKTENGIAEDISRDETLPENTEKIVRKYIAGKIGSMEFREVLGDSPMTPQLLQLAERLKTELRKRYRW